MPGHDPNYQRRYYARNQLAKLNSVRARRGKPPYESIAEIGMDLIEHAANRPRDDGGRFV